MTTLQLRSIDLPGRVRLDVALHGDADGVPVVALHGVSDSRHSFDLLLPHLPPGLRLVAPSQRGHGDSGRPESGYRPVDFADDLAALLDALGIASALVVGHSMGSLDALRFAVDHPRRVRGLLLIGATPAFGANAELVEFHRRDIATLRDPIDPGFVADFQRSTLTRPVPPAFFELACAESRKMPARVWHAAFDGFMAEDLRPALPSIGAPALVLWGRHDAFCRFEDQQALLAMPRARLAVFEDCGHALHWEDPARCARELADFALAAAAAGPAHA